jgi:NADH:ubiquinone oxidoreductase subunit F (NADH-binding)
MKTAADYVEQVLTKHVNTPNCHTLDFYVKNDKGYEALRKALAMKPGDIVKK